MPSQKRPTRPKRREITGYAKSTCHTTTNPTRDYYTRHGSPRARKPDFLVVGRTLPSPQPPWRVHRHCCHANCVQKTSARLASECARLCPRKLPVSSSFGCHHHLVDELHCSIFYIDVFLILLE